MKCLSSLIFFSLLLFSCAVTPPFEPAPTTAALPAGITPFLEQTMAVDREVKVGTLENGMRYYVRYNKKPEKRLELRLVVKVGSVLEEEQQQGLAHFVEHMAFNGSEHFARQELVDYLESIGMAFGPEVNAYTGFDETIYMLQMPTDSVEVMEMAFQILGDWAHLLSFEGEEIDKERGVVIEKWRLGRGAEARMRDEQLPVLLRGSRYAERLPIGQKAVLDTFAHETLRDFYRSWYRPELMAVIAVGDCDPQWVEEQIKTIFSRIPAADESLERPFYPVPDHRETLFTIVSDPQATRSRISIYYKMEVRQQQTIGAYRRHLVEALYQRMLNQRFYELTTLADPPFLFARSSQGMLVRTKEGHILGAGVADGGILRALEALLIEVRRVGLHGFTQSELEREKKEILHSMEQAFRERDETESHRYAAEYKRNFLVDEPIPGLEYEYGLYQTFVPEISLEEVKQVAGKWLGEENRVVAVSLPEKEGIEPPVEETLMEVFTRVAAMELEPYENDVSIRELVEQSPPAAPIVATREFAEIGVTEWTLENGVRAVFKPTNFKNDEILFHASSPGGHSLVADEDYVAALTAEAVVREGGLGAFDKPELEKMLTGKVVDVSPWIEGLQEGLKGSASPEDVETMFQLIYLYFTAPRQDSTAFVSYQTWIRGMIENRSANPEAVFSDSVRVTLFQHHLRARPWSDELLDEMDLERSLRVYRERFGDAGDFTFFFAGNFTLDEIRPLVQRYLGGLPSTGRRERWKDIGLDPPRGVVEKQIYWGLEAKSLSRLVFTGDFEWSYENFFAIHSMAGVLRIKLRELLREELSGTYGVGIGISTSHYPEEEYSLSLSFGCAPERVDELTEVIFAHIDSLQRFGPDSTYVQKVQKMQRRQHEARLKENGFWIDALETAYFHGLDPRIVLGYEEMVKNLDSKMVQRMAQRCFDRENYVRVVLFPEAYKH